MTGFLKSRRYGEGLINLNNGHTPRSPGGVFGGRTEFEESRRLINAVKERLGTRNVKITEGTKGYSSDDILFVFHKGASPKNAVKKGAEIFVSESASARTQYRAYRLLTCLCEGESYRFRGVHTVTEKSPFKSFRTLDSENAYLIKTGHIDCPQDNEISDRELFNIADALSGEIMRIYEEKKNENYS